MIEEEVTENPDGTVNIAKLGKAKALMRLVNASFPKPLAAFIPIRPAMSLEDASAAIEEAQRSAKERWGSEERFRGIYFDYVGTRVVKTDFTTHVLDLRLYDRDMGDGAGIRALRGEPPKEEGRESGDLALQTLQVFASLLPPASEGKVADFVSTARKLAEDHEDLKGFEFESQWDPLQDNLMLSVRGRIGGKAYVCCLRVDGKALHPFFPSLADEEAHQAISRIASSVRRRRQEVRSGGEGL